jgi:hypothetical protein
VPLLAPDLEEAPVASTTHSIAQVVHGILLVKVLMVFLCCPEHPSFCDLRDDLSLEALFDSIEARLGDSSLLFTANKEF